MTVVEDILEGTFAQAGKMVEGMIAMMSKVEIEGTVVMVGDRVADTMELEGMTAILEGTVDGGWTEGSIRKHCKYWR